MFLACQAEGRAMLRHGDGAIVNIASMSGSIVNRGLLQVHYNAAMAGVVHLTELGHGVGGPADPGRRNHPGLHRDPDETAPRSPTR